MKTKSPAYLPIAAWLLIIFISLACNLLSSSAATAPTAPPTALQPTQAPATSTLQPTAPPAQDPNPPLALPFSDNFDDGLDSAWRVITGKPLIDAGRLATVSEELIIEIGNTALQTYVLELDISGNGDKNCGTSYNRYLDIRLAPTLRYRFYYRDLTGRSEWFSFENGGWKRFKRVEGMKCGHFRLDVNSTVYRVTINGQLIDELIFDPAQGPLQIILDPDFFLDNLEVYRP